MHIVIDRKKLLFLPIKHENIFVIGDLVWIEAPRAHVHAAALDHSFLDGYTDLEMMLLYKNTVEERATRVGNGLRNILYEIADRMPVREVNAFELSRQAEQVPEKSKKGYLYNPGGLKPVCKNELFDLDPVKMSRAENETLIAARPRVRPPVVRLPPSATPTASSAAPRPVRAPTAPRQGGVRELVWAVADKLWEASGKPTDIPVVLKLRKEMMGVLESEHSVKRTSSSNELGQWQKARI